MAFKEPRHKTRFVVEAKPYVPPAPERQEVHASLDKLRALLPADIDPTAHPTLLFAVGNLAVGGVVNLNDDAVTLEDTLRTYRGFEWQLVDVEHNRGELRGFIVKAGLSELGTDRLITEDEARAAGKPCNVAIVIALWQVVDADLCAFLEAADAPGSPDKGKLSFSFEVGFDDYDIVVLPKGASNLALATKRITPDSPDFAHYDRMLRVNGGKGMLKEERIARIIMGNILPLGAGIVTVPAAAVKGLTTITRATDPVMDAVVDANAYPYGSKCPTCAAPTVTTERKIGPDAHETCSNGHHYLRGEAIKVEANAGLYRYSSTQCTLSTADAAPLLAYAQSIPADHVYEDEDDPTLGREDEPHITACYGIVGADHAPIAACFAGFGPIRATLGKVSAFVMEGKPYDVLIAEVDSPDLHRAHHLIKTATAVESKWPTYVSHCTIAYLRKGMTSGYVGDTRFAGTTLSFNSLTFSPHTGDRVEIPLVAPAAVTDQFGQVPEQRPSPAQTEAAPVYTEDEAMATPTRFIKLSQGWQDRLAAIQAAAGKDPLVNGVTLTLSDGRTLSNVKVFDGATLELDKELSMSGVVITDMTPGAPPQSDDQINEHPAKADVYPTTTPEQQARDAAALEQQKQAQRAAYTDAMTKAFDELIAAVEASKRATSAINTTAAGVSPSTTPTPPMNLDTLKQSLASVKTVEELPTAVANVTLFAEEIARASAQMAEERKAAQTAAAEALEASKQVQAQLADVQKKYDDMIAAQAAAAAETAFQERMTAVNDAFAFDDEIRAEVVDEIKALPDAAAFAKWMTSAKKKMKGWLKSAKKPDDDGDDDDAKAAKAAAQTALASAATNVVDAPITNNLEVNDKSLKDRYAETFAKNIRIGGETVEQIATRAKGKK